MPYYTKYSLKPRKKPIAGLKARKNEDRKTRNYVGLKKKKPISGLIQRKGQKYCCGLIQRKEQKLGLKKKKPISGLILEEIYLF